jgi:hypothetical protein
VEKVTILFTDEVLDYLDNLIYILYQDKYFSFLENSHNYVLGIYDFIDENIPSAYIKTAPKSLLKYGDFLYFLQFQSKNNLVYFLLQKTVDLFDKTHYKQSFVG